jgi:hypothetical protein
VQIPGSGEVSRRLDFVTASAPPVAPDVAAAARSLGASTVRVRSTLTPAADGNSMTALWERSAMDTC